jgi:hypothetical protein
MELRPSDADLPPFFNAVRRRHPDVDIVVLPDEGPTEAGEEVSTAEVEAGLARVADVVARAWAAATDVPAEPEVRLGYGPHPGTVVARARILTRTAEGEQVVGALHEVLAQYGWRLGRVRDLARFQGRRDDLHVRVSYVEVSGGVLVELTSDPMPVGSDRARELVRR